MNLPAQSTDVWKTASHEDQIKALILLGTLPAREADNTTVDKAAYYLALDGVTLHGLHKAVRGILQGSLGHVFFPNPAELRIECDKAMAHHKRMQERIARQERIRRETPPSRPPLTPEQQIRREAVMASFNAAQEALKEADIEAERADIRARYGMTQEVLALMKDAPLPEGMAQVGQSMKAAK